MNTHLTYVKTTNRSSELTRAAQQVRHARADRFGGPEVATSAVGARPVAWVRRVLTERRRQEATVA
jgi:hypothetical protein